MPPLAPKTVLLVLLNVPPLSVIVPLKTVSPWTVAEPPFCTYVPTPGDEGLWAYEKDAPTKGGWVLTQVGESRVSAAEFANLQRAGM